MNTNNTILTEKEIRTICEYAKRSLKRIIPDINEIRNVCYTKDGFTFQTNTFNTIPVMFQSVIVNANVFVSSQPNEDGEFNIVIHFDYRWKTYSNGSNGTELGTMVMTKYEDRLYIKQNFTFSNMSIIRDIDNLEEDF